MEELGGFEEIVFVILFDDTELIGFGERAEMDRCRIYRGGNIHKLKAECAAGQREIAHVADESDVGIVDGDVEIGLIAEARGLIGGRGVRGFFLLGSYYPLPAGGGIKRHDSSQQSGRAGEDPGQAALPI